jgi:hypothetical protein
MIDTLTSLPFWPLGILAYLGLGLIFAGASGLPLFLANRPSPTQKIQFIADPYLVTWILSIGLMALVYWPLVITALVSTVLITRTTRPINDSGAQWLTDLTEFYERQEHVGRAHLEALGRFGQPLLLHDLVDGGRWDEVLQERYEYMLEYVDSVLEEENNSPKDEERFRQRLTAALLVWGDLSLAWHLEHLGITQDLENRRLVDSYHLDASSPAADDIQQINAILSKKPYSNDEQYSRWIVEQTNEWATSGAADQAHLLQIWESQKQWLPDGIYLLVGERLTGETKPSPTL